MKSERSKVRLRVGLYRQIKTEVVLEEVKSSGRGF